MRKFSSAKQYFQSFNNQPTIKINESFGAKKPSYIYVLCVTLNNILNNLNIVQKLLTHDQQIFNLDKFIWTHDDYEQMGWHDCSIYGLTFLPVDEKGTTNLLFDIDYIFKWVNPAKPGLSFSFWVSPCTLIFKDTFALTINVDRRGGTTDMLEIADLYLVDKVEQEKNNWIYEWNIDLQEGHIKFKSSGFDQIVRQKPIYTDGQFLTLEERNGISFSQTPLGA